MVSGGQKRSRSERISAMGFAPGQWERAWNSLQRRDLLMLTGLALVTAVAMCVVIKGWDPPFAYRMGYTPARDIITRVAFKQYDRDATRDAQHRAETQVRYIYANDPEPLVQLRAKLRNALSEVTAAENLDKLDKKLWEHFQPSPTEDQPTPSKDEQQKQFNELREAVAGQEKLDLFVETVASVLLPFEQHGLLLLKLPQGEKGNQEEIRVHPVDNDQSLHIVQVSDVLLGDGAALYQTLSAQLGSEQVADRVFAWIRPRLVDTLVLNEKATGEAIETAVIQVEQVFVTFEVGSLGQPLGRGGEQLDAQAIELFRLEYQADLAQRTSTQRATRAAVVVVMIFVMFLLCGLYMRYRQRGPLASIGKLIAILVMGVVTVALACWVPGEPWRADVISLVFFSMTMAIVYRHELALLLCGALALIVVFGTGNGLQEFLLLTGVSATAILNMGRIRNRSKLVYVGLLAASVAALLDIGLGVLDNQPLDNTLLRKATWDAAQALAAGFIVTGLLPFIERLFGVLTDLSLLELGDVAHPLLQELVRRAPSTYNHSVTVGSISEAAAESIGARGLLVRVGAYFHDIGKMLKPGYFIENQGSDVNRHETLVPAMSSLVIVAHIKDGADLARKHHLPQPIVDLVEQHHGTTLVGFFYERASQQQKDDPDAAEVEERTYRYPGPKPQTKEAAVLMLADAVESASRTLVDPTPARIERLVGQLAERRLQDGQFDESGVTLRELRTIQRSMVMSLTSIYHGRLKYPDQNMD
jgi:putative nucleotidyltransferase with HDIG domain